MGNATRQIGLIDTCSSQLLVLSNFLILIHRQSLQTLLFCWHFMIPVVVPYSSVFVFLSFSRCHWREPQIYLLVVHRPIIGRAVLSTIMLQGLLHSLIIRTAGTASPVTLTFVAVSVEQTKPIKPTCNQYDMSFFKTQFSYQQMQPLFTMPVTLVLCTIVRISTYR